MESSTFWKKIFIQIAFPFNIEEVKSIESNCGSTWIDMNDGTTYHILIDKCESEESVEE